MFSNKYQLNKRTPENGINRENFLSLLVDEYLNSTSYGEFVAYFYKYLNFLIGMGNKNVLGNKI